MKTRLFPVQNLSSANFSDNDSCIKKIHFPIFLHVQNISKKIGLLMTSDFSYSDPPQLPLLLRGYRIPAMEINRILSKKQLQI